MRWTALVFCLLLPLSGADKKIEPAQAGNEIVEVTGFALLGREAVKAAIGVDPGLDMIAVEIRLRPKTDAPIAISRDDFVLISRRDGQKSMAMHPSQIAGSTSLVVASSGPSGPGGMLGGRRGPIWGGVPGAGGRPRRVGGDDDTAIGDTTDGTTRATVKDSGETDNPALAALKKKELPLAKTAEPAAGLLYFIFDGKQKLKDLELMYKAPGGTLMLDFQK